MDICVETPYGSSDLLAHGACSEAPSAHEHAPCHVVDFHEGLSPKPMSLRASDEDAEDDWAAPKLPGGRTGLNLGESQSLNRVSGLDREVDELNDVRYRPEFRSVLLGPTDFAGIRPLTL